MAASPPGAWALLKRGKGATWRVTGGAMDPMFFFKTATPKELAEMVNGGRYRLVFCPCGVRVGVTVALRARPQPRGAVLEIVWPDAEAP